MRARRSQKEDGSAAAEQNSKQENDNVSHVFTFNELESDSRLAAGDPVGEGDGGGGAVFMFDQQRAYHCCNRVHHCIDLRSHLRLRNLVEPSRNFEKTRIDIRLNVAHFRNQLGAFYSLYITTGFAEKFRT